MAGSDHGDQFVKYDRLASGWRLNNSTRMVERWAGDVWDQWGTYEMYRFNGPAPIPNAPPVDVDSEKQSPAPLFVHYLIGGVLYEKHNPRDPRSRKWIEKAKAWSDWNIRPDISWDPNLIITEYQAQAWFPDAFPRVEVVGWTLSHPDANRYVLKRYNQTILIEQEDDLFVFFAMLFNQPNIPDLQDDADDPLHVPLR